MRKLIAASAAALVLVGCGMTPTAKAPTQAGGAFTASKAKLPATNSKAPTTDAFLHISYVTANGIMGTSFKAPPNYRVNLRAECFVTNPWELTWNWRAFGPIFGFNENAQYTTPNFEGTYTVDVQVRDRSNGWDWKTLYFRVEKNAKLAKTELSPADKAGAQGPAPAETK